MTWTTSGMLLSFLCLLCFLGSASALPMPQPGNQCMISYCPSYFAYFPPRGPRRRPTPTIPSRTNAQRLAGGLGPNPPIRRGKIGTPRQRWAASPSPVAPAHPKATHCGVIRLNDASTGSAIGYIGRTSYGKFRGHLFTNESVSDAVTACFKIDQHSTHSSDLSIALEDWNLKSDFPLLALIQGKGDKSSDIGPHSSNYLTMGGVEWPGTPPGSTPTAITNSYTFYSGGLDRTAESSVWNIDLTTGALTAHWTNPDRRQTTAHVFSLDNILYAGGDLDAFMKHYTRKIVPLTLHFVPW
ncbi:hypothetical protein CVT26_004666 [Gymnopilus dilepis]|uniref:Uncharacterized protein n=1 Tax=Gymnopilus dilepis TaxID=231916 RepID=A0A409YJC7_9AGAR|nr:hypothetical protein CVT26_004666 [Gymnopilus dilepis]